MSFTSLIRCLRTGDAGLPSSGQAPLGRCRIYIIMYMYVYVYVRAC